MLHGLTWDHPRGYMVLDELARCDAAGDERHGRVPASLRWDRQPLEGFESRPISELAARYDVLVIDHPGLADAVQSGALLAMDELFTVRELARWRAATIGQSFGSYRYGGQQWALPLDAATQVCAVRADLLRNAPVTWEEVRTLARSQRIALCLAGPHALMMLLALVTAAGAEPFALGTFLTPQPAAEALVLMADLWAHADQELSLRNPIGVLDAMAGGAEVACCPLVYGYVSYARAGPGRRALRVSDAPRWQAGSRPGSVLGGTGLAVSASARDLDAVRAHLRRLMSEQVQAGLAPLVGGQPSARAAWTAGDVNAQWGDFYRHTVTTLETAWVRPRRLGWVAFQDRASAIVRAGLTAGSSPERIIDMLNDLERKWPWT